MSSKGISILQEYPNQDNEKWTKDEILQLFEIKYVKDMDVLFLTSPFLNFSAVSDTKIKGRKGLNCIKFRRGFTFSLGDNCDLTFEDFFKQAEHVD